MTKAIDVARFLVKKFIDMGKPATNMKIQKLLYYAWIDYYKTTEKYLFEDNFKAWKFGPVVEDVYREYRIFAAMPITVTSDCKKLDSGVEEFLTNFAKMHANDSALYLMSRTHENGKPWKECYQEGMNFIIPFKRIVEIECQTA